MSKEKEITAFIDHVGRAVVGRLVKSTKDTIHVDNPAVVNINVQQENNQIAVQLLPYFFREFISQDAKDGNTTWVFEKKSIVTSTNLCLNDNLVSQYKGIFDAPIGQLQPGTALGESPQEVTDVPDEDVVEPEVVKLFDD